MCYSLGCTRCMIRSKPHPSLELLKGCVEDTRSLIAEERPIGKRHLVLRESHVGCSEANTCAVPTITEGVDSMSGKNCVSGAKDVAVGTNCQITAASGYTCTSPGECGSDGSFPAVGSCTVRTQRAAFMFAHKLKSQSLSYFHSHSRSCTCRYSSCLLIFGSRWDDL